MCLPAHTGFGHLPELTCLDSLSWQRVPWLADRQAESTCVFKERSAGETWRPSRVEKAQNRDWGAPGQSRQSPREWRAWFFIPAHAMPRISEVTVVRCLTFPDSNACSNFSPFRDTKTIRFSSFVFCFELRKNNLKKLTLSLIFFFLSPLPHSKDPPLQPVSSLHPSVSYSCEEFSPSFQSACGFHCGSSASRFLQNHSDGTLNH